VKFDSDSPPDLDKDGAQQLTDNQP